MTNSFVFAFLVGFSVFQLSYGLQHQIETIGAQSAVVASAQ